MDLLKKYLNFIFIISVCTLFMGNGRAGFSNIELDNTVISELYQCYNKQKCVLKRSNKIKIHPLIIEVRKGQLFSLIKDSISNISVTIPYHVINNFNFYIKKDSNGIQMFMLPKYLKLKYNDVLKINKYYYIDIHIIDKKVFLTRVCTRIE